LLFYGSGSWAFIGGCSNLSVFERMVLRTPEELKKGTWQQKHDTIMKCINLYNEHEVAKLINVNWPRWAGLDTNLW
jgi:hypothetical protein